MNADPLINLHMAFTNTGYVYDTGQQHNGRKVVLTYDKNIGENIHVSGAGKMLMHDGSIVYCVVVDTNFMLLPKEEQLVMFYHELGHIVNGHLDKPFKMTINKIARLLGLGTMEFEADKYAARKTSIDKVIVTLKHVANTIPFISQKDVQSRIKRLRKA